MYNPSSEMKDSKVEGEEVLYFYLLWTFLMTYYLFYWDNIVEIKVLLLSISKVELGFFTQSFLWWLYIKES